PIATALDQERRRRLKQHRVPVVIAVLSPVEADLVVWPHLAVDGAIGGSGPVITAPQEQELLMRGSTGLDLEAGADPYVVDNFHLHRSDRQPKMLFGPVVAFDRAISRQRAKQQAFSGPRRVVCAVLHLGAGPLPERGWSSSDIVAELVVRGSQKVCFRRTGGDRLARRRRGRGRGAVRVAAPGRRRLPRGRTHLAGPGARRGRPRGRPRGAPPRGRVSVFATRGGEDDESTQGDQRRG